MILKNIKYIKNFGIFSDYTPTAELLPFRRYNLIYGWNGTGKTTLTRLMRCFETGKIYEDFATGKFIIDCEEGQISDKNLEGISGRLKVFNKDFIEENIDLDIKKGGTANPIVHLGKVNVEKNQRLKVLKNDIAAAEESRDNIKTQADLKEDALGKLASAIASEIKGVTQTARADQYKNYNKSNVKKQYENEGFITEYLTPEEHNSLKSAINAENKVTIDFTLSILPDLQALKAEIETILKTQILATETIQRLKENIEIENWIREGTKLHPHIDGVLCEFCGNAVKEQRLDELQRHFSGEREKFFNMLNAKISTLEEQRKSLSTLKIPNWTEFFPEFQEEYKSLALTLSEFSTTDLPTLFNKIISALTDKKRNPYGPVPLIEGDWDGIDSLNTEFPQKQSDVQELIRKHNKKVNDFETSIKEDKEKLERSILTTKKPEYEAVKNEVERLRREYNASVEECQNNIKKYCEIKKEIHKTRVARKFINSNLENYLGHKEIQFEDFEEGYIIKRNGEIAKNLSEGEKTAIAFVYFIATLKDNFDPASSIIVIDDPVSSLDANNIHHAFHFMVAHVKDAGQLFILTHNFSFLRKAKRWLKAITKQKHGAAKPEDTQQYYQIMYSMNDNGKRAAHLSELDPLLKNYDSEYHYLFKLLIDCHNKCVANENVPYEELYPLINVGRKVLETFLDFKYPSNPDKYSQVTNAKVQATGELFDKTKSQLIYGLFNDGSHAGFDTGGFDTFRNSPKIIKRGIEGLLDFIEKVDPTHYKSLGKCKGVKSRTKVIPDCNVI